jgi:hypothetical protein
VRRESQRINKIQGNNTNRQVQEKNTTEGDRKFRGMECGLNQGDEGMWSSPDREGDTEVQSEKS